MNAKGVWLIAHARDPKGELLLYPPVESRVTSRDGERSYVVLPNGSIRRLNK
jgi:hypothetical protein